MDILELKSTPNMFIFCEKTQSGSPKFSFFLFGQILRLNREYDFWNRKLRTTKIDRPAFSNRKIKTMNLPVLKFNIEIFEQLKHILFGRSSANIIFFLNSKYSIWKF